MSVLVAGDVCGLGTLLDVSEHYYATAESIEPTEVLIWSRSTLHRLAAIHPQLSQNALRVALRYVAVFAERHIQLVSGTAEQRLARTLTRLGSQSGIPTPTGVDVAITNELLAALSDVSPFTASRTLGSWSRDGCRTEVPGPRVHHQPGKAADRLAFYPSDALPAAKLSRRNDTAAALSHACELCIHRGPTTREKRCAWWWPTTTAWSVRQSSAFFAARST